MNDPITLELKLKDSASPRMPNDLLSGTFHITGPRRLDVRAIELSVLWFTEGKGDEDMAVHFFQRWTPELQTPLPLAEPQPFATPLPAGPLSYHGAIVKICWCARLRAFLPKGLEFVTDLPFVLGNVPAATWDTSDEREPSELSDSII